MNGRANESDFVASLVNEQPANAQQFMSVDKYGAVVPYFHQIEDELGVLGGGRCGEVKKIRWQGEFEFAAKKLPNGNTTPSFITPIIEYVDGNKRFNVAV